jgi:hypothetical protein
MAKAVIIGGTTFTKYRTWASLRTAFGRYANMHLYFIENFSYNRNYEVSGSNILTAFMSAAPGSGLIRADRYARTSGYPVEFRNFFVTQVVGMSLLELDWFDDDLEEPSTLIPKEIQEELLGETAEFQDGVTTAVLAIELFSPPDAIQEVPYGHPTLSTGQVISIGKLTQIT